MPRTSHVLPWPGANLWVTQHGMCEVLFYSLYHSLYLLFSQQTRTKNVRSKQGLSNLNINTRYQYHVCNLYPCNIVQHCISSAIRKDSTRRFIKMLLSQICLNWRVYIRSTKMCCLARLQIHDGATIPQKWGNHHHCVSSFACSVNLWVITQHPNIIEYWLSIIIWMIPAQHKPTLFGFCDKQQNHLTRLLSGLACCTATFLCIYIDCLAVKESPITQLDVLLTSRGNTACQRQVSKLYYTSYHYIYINKYIDTYITYMIYNMYQSVENIRSAIKTTFPTHAANPDLRAQHDQLFLQRWPLGCCHLRWRFYRGSKYFRSW